MLRGPISRVIAGTARMGSPLPDALVRGGDRQAAFRLLDGFVDVGCTAFDLAAAYQLGGTERLFGAWLASRGHRDRLYLISKGGHPYPVVKAHRLGPEALAADLHASLKRLGTDRLDLYLAHKDDPDEPLDSVLDTMAGFQRQGKILAWGVSNWTPARLRALVALAEARGVEPPAASSPQYSLAGWEKAPWAGSVSLAGDGGRAGRAFHEETQLPVLAWSPLGSGFFARASGTGGVGSSGPRAYETHASLARRERAERLARARGVTTVQVALAYLFAQTFPVFAIVSASTTDKMRSNIEATRLTLSADDLRWLDLGEGAPPA